MLKLNRVTLCPAKTPEEEEECGGVGEREEQKLNFPQPWLLISSTGNASGVCDGIMVFNTALDSVFTTIQGFLSFMLLSIQKTCALC